jgi:site-specific DNA-cytosine methylase
MFFVIVANRHFKTDCGSLLNCASKLKSLRATDVRDPFVTKTLPRPFLFSAGFSFVDKCKLSSNKSKLKSGIQNGKGQTYMTWSYVYEYIKIHKPFVFVLENLKEIFELSEFSFESDGAFIIKQLELASYMLVTYLLADAQAEGSPATRFRIYFVGILKLRALTGVDAGAFCQEVSDFIHEFFASLRAYPANTEKFLMTGDLSTVGDEDDEDIVAESANPLPKKAKKDPETMQYKSDHFEIYRDAEMVWPPPLHHQLGGVTYDFTNMPHQRVKEIAIYLSQRYTNTDKFKPMTCQFVDCNNNIKRILNWDEATLSARATEPWHEFVPNLTTKSQIICRFIDYAKKVTHIKQLQGAELMLMIGYPKARCSELASFPSNTLTHLAGNAFSGFSAGCVVTAALVGAVKAGVTSADIQSTGGDVEEDADEASAAEQDSSATDDKSSSSSSD